MREGRKEGGREGGRVNLRKRRKRGRARRGREGRREGGRAYQGTEACLEVGPVTQVAETEANAVNFTGIRWPDALLGGA